MPAFSIAQDSGSKALFPELNARSRELGGPVVGSR